MDLDAEPFDLEVELLTEPFDKSLADVAERSDVVGEDADGVGMEASYGSLNGSPLFRVFRILVEKALQTRNRERLRFVRRSRRFKKTIPNLVLEMQSASICEICG